MYHSQYKYTRCGAISPGDSSKVAHDSRRLFTFHAIYQLKNGINFQHLVYLVNRPKVRTNQAR